MLEPERLKRQSRIEAEAGALAYERYQLGRQIEACQKRIADIDRTLAEREGALKESEQTRRDIESQAAIEKAKAEKTNTEVDNG